MNPEPSFTPWTRIESACTGPIRVLELQHVGDDTYAILEDGGVYLSDAATLKQLLEHLPGRTP